MEAEKLLTRFVLGVMQLTDGRLPLRCCDAHNVSVIEKALEAADPQFANVPIEDKAIIQDALFRIVACIRRAEKGPAN